jgi:hypothetical protein
MGSWFASFIGYWFGGATPVPPVTEPDPLCNPTVVITRDLFTVEPQADLFTYTIQDC